MTVDYEDTRFQDVKDAEKAALTENERLYAGMINQSDKYYKDQMNAVQDWADKQTQIQQEQTDFTIEKIEQNKEQAQKDYTREQSGAYVDWQKQKNDYGVNAEKQAAAGLTNSGYSESAKVSMYNTYQTRVTAARETFSLAVRDFDNAIKEASLQNNAILAEIAAEAFQKKLELSLQRFQYKNQLLLDKADKKTQIKNTYYKQWQDVLAQINRENALAEEKRQFDILHPRAESEDGSDSSDEVINKDAGTSDEGDGSGGTPDSPVENPTHGTPIGKATTTHTFQVNIHGSSSGSQIDMNSVRDLGYGPISAATLNGLVASGQVEEYSENGTIKFRKTIGGPTAAIRTPK